MSHPPPLRFHAYEIETLRAVQSKIINMNIQSNKLASDIPASQSTKLRTSSNPSDRSNRACPAVRLNPTISDQIRVTFSTALWHSAVKKSEMKIPRKPLKFNFLKLSKTFFLMAKLKVGKGTVKFLAIFEHQPLTHQHL